MDTPSLKSLTGSSGANTHSSTLSSSSSSSSSSNSSAAGDRRLTPKSKVIGENDAKLNFKPYDINGRHRSIDAELKNLANGKITPSHVNGKGASPRSQVNGQEAKASSSAPLSYTSLGLPDMHKDSLAAFYKAYGLLPNCCPSTGAAGPFAGLMPPPITLDKTGAYPSIYPPAPSSAAAAAMSAMYNYARAKDMSGLVAGAPGAGVRPGSPPLHPSAVLCYDPYCGGACGQYGLHANSHSAFLAASALRGAEPPGVSRVGATGANNQNGAAAPCSGANCPGCSQCEHYRLMAAYAAYSQPLAGLAAAAGYPPGYAQSLAAAMHQRTSAAAAATGNVCVWIIGGDQQCGKRFATPEELFQHLKSHAVPSASTESLQQNAQPKSTQNSNSRPGSSNGSAHKVPSPATAQHYATGAGGAASPHSARLSSSSASSPSHASSHHSSRYHPYSKPSVSSANAAVSAASTTTPAGLSLSAMNAMLYHHGVGMSPVGSTAPSPSSVPGPHPYPFGPAGMMPMMPPSLAPSLYYPFMPPAMFNGRMGPAVPQ